MGIASKLHPSLTQKEYVVHPRAFARYELKDWKLTTSIFSLEYLHAVRGVNWLKPPACSNGRITDLISLLTLELSIEEQYTSNLVEIVRFRIMQAGSSPPEKRRSRPYGMRRERLPVKWTITDKSGVESNQCARS